MSRARQGDDDAFGCLYERYRSPVTRYIQGRISHKTDGEDLCQDVFFRAFQQIHRSSKADRPMAFRPWIFEIAKNACIDQYRLEARRPETSSLGLEEIPAVQTDAYDPEAALLRKQRLKAIVESIKRLSRSQRSVLLARDFLGLSYREIAARLGISLHAVESALFRARIGIQVQYAILSEESPTLRPKPWQQTPTQLSFQPSLNRLFGEG